MMMTVKFTDVYDDEEHERTQAIMVSAPPSDDLEEWAETNISPYTGDGNAITKNAGYFAEIIECGDRPELVGREFEWMG